jgi:CDP-4-dehydro-6-deoxyglucose reductase, E3
MGGTRPHAPSYCSRQDMPSRRRLRLVSRVPLSPSVSRLQFEVEGGAFDYDPGQVLDLYVPSPSGMWLKRPYSIASAPGHAGANRIEFAVTQVQGGPASTALSTLEPGAMVQAEGPRGGFVRHEADRVEPTLFVATGSGLAPFRAMLQQELAEPGGPPLTLLFGCRTAEHVLWSDEIAAWTRTHDRFSAWITLSRADAAWSGLRGYVQQHLAGLVEAFSPATVFVCGLSPMVTEVGRILSERGLPRPNLRTESYDV